MVQDWEVGGQLPDPLQREGLSSILTWLILVTCSHEEWLGARLWPHLPRWRLLAPLTKAQADSCSVTTTSLSCNPPDEQA